MEGLLGELGITNPVIAAPMAGGPTTPELVVAAARAGSLGFLAAGYKTTEELARQIEIVRSGTATFGVNLFVPTPVPVDVPAYRRYAAALQPDADLYGLDLADTSIREDDDWFGHKVDLVVGEGVRVVSFTFGVVGPEVVTRLRRSGAIVVQTVTSVAEARQAEESGVDALAVQGQEAGGHYGTFTPDVLPEPTPLAELLGRVGAAVRMPLLAAGGVGSAADVKSLLGAGAAGVAVGTALLLTDESGASATYKTALRSGGDRETVVTRAFSGRPARALRGSFTDRFTAVAPSGYPAIHHLTSPLRRAAAAAGDGERINVWAGTGHAQALAYEGSATAVLTSLASEA